MKEAKVRQTRLPFSFCLYPFGIFLGRSQGINTLAHEMVHWHQQKSWAIVPIVGPPAWVFCYLMIAPYFWNPFRWHWEMQAFQEGSKLTKEEATEVLASPYYGLLYINKWCSSWASKLHK